YERGPVREGGHVRDGRGVRRHPRPHGRDGRHLVTAMDFSFSPAELRFAAEARGWLEANLPAAWRRDHCWTRVEEPLWLEVARAWQRLLHDGGWAAVAWPREHGGRAPPPLERCPFHPPPPPLRPPP